MYILKLGWYLQLEECSMIWQSERIQIYSQSSQTPLTDCFTLTGSSEGNLKQHTTLQTNNIQYKNNFCNVVCCFRFPSDDPVRVKQSVKGV